MNKEMKLEEYLSEKELLSNQKKEITRLESVLRNYFKNSLILKNLYYICISDKGRKPIQR